MALAMTTELIVGQSPRKLVLDLGFWEIDHQTVKFLGNFYLAAQPASVLHMHCNLQHGDFHIICGWDLLTPR